MQVVFRIQPHRYIHKHQCAQQICVHHHPVYRGTVSRSQFRWIMRQIREQHGKDVKIQRKRWRRSEADVVLAYLQHSLTDSGLVITFQQWIHNMLLREHNKYLATA